LPGGRRLDAALSRLGPLLGRWWLPLACVPVTLPFLLVQGGQYPFVRMGGLSPAGLTLAWYGAFFAAGWLLHRHADQLHRLRRWAWGWVFLGLAVRVATLGPLLPDVGLSALLSGDVAVPVHEHFLARELELPVRDRVLVQLGADAYAWLLFFGQTGLFLRWFRREIPVVRWFADASYWLFLSHLVPVALAQWWLAGVDPPLGALGRYLLVATGVLVACLLAYETLVRTTPVGTLLHGPRRRPPGGRAANFRWRPAP
jgi:glucan biosynthesis protein C